MKIRLGLVSLHVLALSTIATSAFAETAADAPQATTENTASDSAQPGQAGVGDIIVTARRRNETSLETPVVLSAFSGEQLSRLNVQNIIDVGKLTPQLALGTANGAYGGVVGLRGVSSPTSNAGAEGAVTVNIDGVPISFGAILRLSAIDLGQVEILKGPQALFFGKNASGGIISIRTAEPTSAFKAQVSGGYEFNARQGDIDGYVSGPLSSTVTARIAGHFSRQRGYFKNTAADPAFQHSPGTDEEAGRLSLNWEPDNQLTVKLRGTIHHVQEAGGYGVNQKFACATPGVPMGGGVVAGYTDCVADNKLALGRIPSAVIRTVTGNPAWNSDKNYYRATQYLLSGEIEYQVNDDITLSSITGYYKIKQRNNDSTVQGGKFYIGDNGRFSKHTWSEELRVSYQNPDVPINLMMGGFYQDDHLTFDQQVVINVGTQAAPIIVKLSEPWSFPIDAKTYSVFGQVGWDITEAFSLSAGVRYSEDRKHLDVVPPLGLPNKVARPKRKFTNWSPELTLAFKPNPNFNLFGSYKQGFKAGAFNVNATTFDPLAKNAAIITFDPSYEPETAKGFEVGLKTLLLDRQLRLNLAAYSYLYKDLQLSRVDPDTKALAILNASSARVKGIEGDLSFSPSGIAGLTLTGAAAYNSARYASSFFGPCYTGQTPAAGCLPQIINGTSVFTQQFLGRRLPRAPEFSGSVGMTYERPISDQWMATFNANGVYTSSQFVSQELSPLGKSPSRFLVDAGLTFGTASKSMEFAVIGRNLTNKHFGVTGFGSFGSGGGTGTAAGFLSDYEGPISRGREIWLKVTLRPSEF